LLATTNQKEAVTRIIAPKNIKNIEKIFINNSIKENKGK
jgi:hypothetical protein